MLLLLWPGVSFTLVGMAYAGLGAPVFGKQADGTLHWQLITTYLTIEHYVDDSYRFSGLWSFVKYVWGRRSDNHDASERPEKRQGVHKRARADAGSERGAV